MRASGKGPCCAYRRTYGSTGPWPGSMGDNPRTVMPSRRLRHVPQRGPVRDPKQASGTAPRARYTLPCTSGRSVLPTSRAAPCASPRHSPAAARAQTRHVTRSTDGPRRSRRPRRFFAACGERLKRHDQVDAANTKSHRPHLRSLLSHGRSRLARPTVTHTAPTLRTLSAECRGPRNIRVYGAMSTVSQNSVRGLV